MGLLEFLLERRNPGPVGDLNADGPGPGPRGDLRTRGLVSAVVIGGWLWVLSESTSSTETFLASVGFSTVYLVVAYFLNPQPDYSNFGLFGGAIDHPCRYTDDINRWLFFLLIVFWPGRFVATAVVDASAQPWAPALARRWPSRRRNSRAPAAMTAVSSTRGKERSWARALARGSAPGPPAGSAAH